MPLKGRIGCFYLTRLEYESFENFSEQIPGVQTIMDQTVWGCKRAYGNKVGADYVHAGTSVEDGVTLGVALEADREGGSVAFL